VRHLKTGFWPARRVELLKDLDDQYRDWRDSVCNRRLYATGRFPVHERLVEERGALRPLPPARFDYARARDRACRSMASSGPAARSTACPRRLSTDA
jgi:hypothetical protein